MNCDNCQFKEPARFWSKVAVGEAAECWEWLAAKKEVGYGVFGIHYRTFRAHRVAWVLTYGPIPEGLCVLHRCDNPSCCNPYHLFLGTQADNLTDAARKGRAAKKLTKDNVRTIRELYSGGYWTLEELGDTFGVHLSTIGRIVSRERWTWLQEA